ncbi:MAG: hypothetical protein ABEH66_05990 [Halobacteriales archaeon]
MTGDALPAGGSLPFPLEGSTLILGPANVGKTRLTARALDAWIGEHGTDGVAVLEFAPELERGGRLLGGRLDRFTRVPDGVWRGVIEARAPRAESEDDEEALGLAGENAACARTAWEAAPAEPRAVFVNDATIPFQAGENPSRLATYCDGADAAVLNAFAGDELGVEDPVSRFEREALSEFRAWADRVVDLP